MGEDKKMFMLFHIQLRLRGSDIFPLSFKTVIVGVSVFLQSSVFACGCTQSTAF